MNCRIVVLNYNGEHYIKKCLPSILKAAQGASHPARVTVLDNQSTDRSLEIIHSQFPEVEVDVAPENKVYCSYNDYFRKIEEPIVIILNNDIRVEEDFIDPLLKAFEEDPGLFLVTPKTMNFDGTEYEGGISQSRIKFGLFWHSSRFLGYERKLHIPSCTMAAGFGAFNRKKLLELGGFDDLFLPGRLEDNDVCFRAWRIGWECYYVPQSIVYHVGGKAFHDKFGKRETLILGHRNSFLFFWKNIRSFRYWFEHLLLLGPRLSFAILTGNRELAVGFKRALPLLKEAFKRRRATENESSARKDKEIFKMVP